MPKAGVAGQDASVGPARLARAPTRFYQSPKSYWVERVGETMAVLSRSMRDEGERQSVRGALPLIEAWASASLRTASPRFQRVI